MNSITNTKPAKPEQNVEILADEQHADTLFLLFVQYVVDEIGRADIKPAHRIRRDEKVRVEVYLSAEENLLDIAA